MFIDVYNWLDHYNEDFKGSRITTVYVEANKTTIKRVQMELNKKTGVPVQNQVLFRRMEKSGKPRNFRDKFGMKNSPFQNVYEPYTNDEEFLLDSNTNQDWDFTDSLFCLFIRHESLYYNVSNRLTLTRIIFKLTEDISLATFAPNTQIHPWLFSISSLKKSNLLKGFPIERVLF